ncbi:ribosomal RNA-processing protein 8 [Ochlerotatus camptorhynchus]|uniref:ribosomal RNA-processing protein 8 n=1 Tax=Ochlerotatus camptorhynchus TaxID=644619 RepID=UPI0031D87009
MDKIFTEHDWDNEDISEQINFSFAKQKPVKKSPKRNKSQSNNNPDEPGRFVRAPLLDNSEPVTTTNGKPKSAKRKSNETVELQHDTELPKPKNKKRKNGSVATESLNGEAKSKPKPTITKTSDFREKLVDSLKGSRFRFINEQLYKTTGTEAKLLFQEDPSAFQAYHEGYRHQIVQWSVNPLDRIIKSFSKLPADYVVADFGCGEARLAEAIEQKVYSLDLVAANNSVIACDMAHTPLETNSINVAVFCLSLMGTNLRDFLLEANRVLKVGGLLKIAEVSSRYNNVKEFIDCVHKCGYLLDNKDLNHKLFYFFNFKKVRSVDKSSFKGKHFSLKPCLYKKR